MESLIRGTAALILLIGKIATCIFVLDNDILFIIMEFNSNPLWLHCIYNHYFLWRHLPYNTYMYLIELNIVLLTQTKNCSNCAPSQFWHTHAEKYKGLVLTFSPIRFQIYNWNRFNWCIVYSTGLTLVWFKCIEWTNAIHVCVLKLKNIHP